jgi:ectoine hydroxylase-related dioxygenase (phytanoyl-CoA dioxygenase family)
VSPDSDSRVAGTAWVESLASDGYARIRSVVSAAERAGILRALEGLPASDAVRQKDDTYAVRNLLEVVPAVGRLASLAAVTQIAERVLGSGAFPVRGTLFDKTPGANWKVPWHQDRTIAVDRRIDVSGFGPWTSKAGVLHVQPPDPVLEQMLSVRIHLDACALSNGPLRVLPGTHREGKLTSQAIQALRVRCRQAVCLADAGDAIVMRPLLVHASSPAQTPGHRRVIHLDFASAPLPGGLEWASRGPVGRV